MSFGQIILLIASFSFAISFPILAFEEHIRCYFLKRDIKKLKEYINDDDKVNEILK